MQLGAQLSRTWRKAKGLSQAEAANATRIDGGQTAWSRLESGQYIPRADEAARIELASAGDVPCSSWGVAVRKRTGTDG